MSSIMQTRKISALKWSCVRKEWRTGERGKWGKEMDGISLKFRLRFLWIFTPTALYVLIHDRFIPKINNNNFRRSKTRMTFEIEPIN